MDFQTLSLSSFSLLVLLFFSFFILFRSFYTRNNIFFALAGLVASGWIYLVGEYSNVGEYSFLLLIIGLPNIFLSLLLLVICFMEEKSQQKFFQVPKWTYFFISLENIILASATIILIFISLFSPNFEEGFSSFFLDAFLFSSVCFSLINSFVISYISCFSLQVLQQKKIWLMEKLFLFFLLSFLTLFSFFYISLVSEIYILSNSDIVLNAFILDYCLSAFAIPILIGAFVFLASYLHWKHFLSYKVSLAQTLGSLLILLGFISIINSTSTENFILRSILLLILLALSHLLVKSVLGEIEKKEAIKKTSEEIFKANQALKSLDRAKSDFISSASHQLRSPLSVIKGVSSMLMDDSYGKLDKAIQDAITKIYISNERLIGLIEDLLDISHLEEGKVEFSFVKKDINELAKRAVMGLSLQAKSKKLYLKFHPCKKPLPVWMDEAKTTEIVSNLIDNAIKYTRKGGITVEVKKAKNVAQILVRDTGIGLKKDEISHLFERFVRAGRGKKLSTVGTGLGLYVAKKMTLAQKAKIWVESAGEGKGSTFIVEFKLDLASPPDEKFIQSILKEKK